MYLKFLAFRFPGWSRLNTEWGGKCVLIRDNNTATGLHSSSQISHLIPKLVICRDNISVQVSNQIVCKYASVQSYCL